jgi:DNA-binding CsgD family transcriptional regulator/N-acetylneuraminic acid mutarotase
MTDSELPPLSDREVEILRLVATGATNQEIASQLVISPYTVKTHLKNIFAKLGVATRTEATMVAVRRGWVNVPQASGPAALVSPAPDVLARPPAPVPALPVLQRWPRVRWIQRVVLVSGLSLALLILLLPQIVATRGNGKAQNAISGVFPMATSVPAPATGQWKTRAQMPSPRSGLAVVAHNGLIYAIGGVSNEGVTGKVEVYDPKTDAWTARQSKPLPVGFVSAAVVGSRVYVPGGVGAGQQIQSVLEVYDPESDSWESKTPLPSPLAAYALAAWGERLYLFGGLDERGYVSSVYCYDPATDRWETRQSMSQARGLLGAAALGERIYVVGGYDDESEFNRCETYDPATDGWAVCSPMALGRGGLALTAVRNNLYAIGGGMDGYLAFNERYDPRLDIWTKIETPVTKQWRGLGAAFVDPYLYGIGGWNGENLSVNEAYQALFYQLIILP